MKTREKKEMLIQARKYLASGSKVALHLRYAQSGMSVRARLYHYDGALILSAGGCGYDRKGTIVGNFLAALYGPELRVLAKTKSADQKGGFHGLYTMKDGSIYVEGGSGFDTMCTLGKALGLEISSMNTGKETEVIFFEKKGN